MSQRDEIYIRRLIEWITDHANYGNITEVCNMLNVDEEWFDQFYEREEEEVQG